MKKKDDSQKGTKASVIWLSMMRSVVVEWKMSTIFARLGIGIRILRRYIRGLGEMIISLGQYRQEKRKDADNAELNEPLDQQESENAVSKSNADLELEALNAFAEDELIEVRLEIDQYIQCKDLIYRILMAGVTDIKVDYTVKDRYANVKFYCFKSQMLKLAITLGKINPPITLGNPDKTGCIAEFRKQLEMAQVLQQQKSNVMH